MATVSNHIEGHEDGSIDDPADLAVVLRDIAQQLMDGAHATGGPLPELPVYDEDDPEPAAWSVQYSRY